MSKKADNRLYNAERKAQAELIKRDLDRDKLITQLYQESYDRLQAQIDKFYLGYAGREGLTKQEAMKRASEFDVTKFAEKARKAVKEKDFSHKTNSWLRVYNLKMKVSRLELLKAELGLEINSLTSNLEEVFDKARRSEYLAEFKRQAGILGISSSGAKKRIESVLDADFYGQSFSSRVWGKTGLQPLLQRDVFASLNRIYTDMNGYQKEMKLLANKYGTSEYNAKRLIKTEIARINSDTDHAMLKDNGFTHMIFVAESGACDICKPLDNTAVPIDKVEKGVNMFPMHPNCRCSAYGHIEMKYKDGRSTLEQFEKWNESEDNIIPEQARENIKIDFSKLTTEEINNLDFDELMKYYEWVEEQEKLKAKQKELQAEAERKLLEERESKVSKTRRDLVSRIEERLRTTNFVDSFGEQHTQGLLRELRFFPNDDFVQSLYGSIDKLSFAKVKEMSSHVSGTQVNLAKGDFIYNKKFNQKAHSIVLHELTHGIDNVASYFGAPELGAKAFSSQYDLYNTIKKDMDNYIFGDMKLKRGASIDEKRNFFELRQAKVRDFKSELLELAKKLNPEIRPEENAEVAAFASDMMSSFRSAEYGSQSFNHSDSYWKNKTHRGMEFIAEYTQAQMTPEIKSFYDKVFPNSVKIYNKIFEDISKLNLENQKPIVW
jgi:SPP1 gp7 family putative phage head morphogenesis protein